jgi:glyoxylase I family protein
VPLYNTRLSADPGEMGIPAASGIAHLGLTVVDMEASAAWYQRVFGWPVTRRFAAGEAGTPRVLLYDAASGLTLSLCKPDGASGNRFDFRTTGLDHFALGVADREQLERWAAHLDRLGVQRSPIRDLGRAEFISLEDPDGVQIEIWLQLVQPTEESATL